MPQSRGRKVSRSVRHGLPPQELIVVLEEWKILPSAALVSDPSPVKTEERRIMITRIVSQSWSVLFRKPREP